MVCTWKFIGSKRCLSKSEAVSFSSQTCCWYVCPLQQCRVRNMSKLSTFLTLCPLPSLGVLLSAVLHSLTLNWWEKLETFQSSLPWENALWDINFKFTLVARFAFFVVGGFLFVCLFFSFSIHFVAHKSFRSGFYCNCYYSTILGLHGTPKLWSSAIGCVRTCA